jgi:DNA-binding transcriptional MerR regulator
MTNKLLEGYLTRLEVAEELNVTILTLVRWEEQQISPPITRIGRNVFYKRRSLEKWIENQECEYKHPTL